MNFEPRIIPECSPQPDSPLLIFTGNNEVVLESSLALPKRRPADHAVYLGVLDGRDCYAERLPSPPDRLEAFGIRGLFSEVPEELYALIGFASQILTWRENHRFCSRCGAEAEPSKTERAMVCPACGLMNYPRISPSMIVAVTRGDELLLARGPHFPEGLYSVLAGFVEPGETLEQCVAREVMEETGIEVANIQYHSSQPWPFPHSLMVGFTADYAGGEIRIDPKEIEDAGWYTADRMPERLPSGAAISRALIEHFLAART